MVTLILVVASIWYLSVTHKDAPSPSAAAGAVPAGGYAAAGAVPHKPRQNGRHS